MTTYNILTVSLNPAIDTTIFTDGLSSEKINSILDQRSDAAGKAVNIAKLLNNFNTEPNLVSFIGENNLDRYLSLFHSSAPNLKCDFIPVSGSVRENLHIILPAKDLVTLRQRGFSVSQHDIALLKEKILNKISDRTIVIISGRFPENFSSSDFRHLCDDIGSRGGMLALDSNSVTKDDILYAKPFVIKPNLDELRDFTGLALDDEKSIKNSLAELFGAGVKNILLSRGPDGIVYYGERGTLWARPPKINVMSTVGAGDSSLSGFILSYINGDDIEKTLRSAVAFGSAAAMLPGTQSPKASDIANIFSEISVIDY